MSNTHRQIYTFNIFFVKPFLQAASQLPTATTTSLNSQGQPVKTLPPNSWSGTWEKPCEEQFSVGSLPPETAADAERCRPGWRQLCHAKVTMKVEGCVDCCLSMQIILHFTDVYFSAEHSVDGGGRRLVIKLCLCSLTTRLTSSQHGKWSDHCHPGWV